MTRYHTASAAVKAALDDAGIKARQTSFVGSSYITDRTDGDVDVLCLINRDPNDIGFDGWLYGGSVHEGGDQWGSWKRTVDGVEVNMLLTQDLTYFMAWCTAAEVCRYLHLSGVTVPRVQRIGIHNIVMDDSDAESEHGCQLK